jgi:hypothetical protein
VFFTAFYPLYQLTDGLWLVAGGGIGRMELERIIGRIHLC